MRPYSNFQEVFKERINSLRDNKPLVNRMFEIAYAANEGNGPKDVLLGYSDGIYERKTEFYHAGTHELEDIGKVGIGISIDVEGGTGYERFISTVAAVTLINEVHGNEWKYLKTPRIIGFLADERSIFDISAVIESFGKVEEAATHPELRNIINESRICFEKPGEEGIYALDFDHFFENQINKKYIKRWKEIYSYYSTLENMEQFAIKKD